MCSKPKGWRPPKRITTDKLHSYGAGIRTEGLSAVHDQGAPGKQSGGEFTPASAKTGRGHGQVPGYHDPAEIRFKPRRRPQSL